MVNIIEINGLLQKLSTTTPLWDVSRWLLLIVKALVMAILISGYALWRARHCYTMTILTGVFHCIAYAQVVIGIYMLSIGVLFAFAKAPVVLVLLLGVFLTIICLLLTMSLITVVGRIVGASGSVNAFEGLLVICGAYIIWAVSYTHLPSISIYFACKLVSLGYAYPLNIAESLYI